MSPYRRYHSFSGCIRNLVVDSQVSVCVCVCPLSLSLPTACVWSSGVRPGVSR